MNALVFFFCFSPWFAHCPSRPCIHIPSGNFPDWRSHSLADDAYGWRPSLLASCSFHFYGWVNVLLVGSVVVRMVLVRVKISVPGVSGMMAPAVANGVDPVTAAMVGCEVVRSVVVFGVGGTHWRSEAKKRSRRGLGGRSFGEAVKKEALGRKKTTVEKNKEKRKKNIKKNQKRNRKRDLI